MDTTLIFLTVIINIYASIQVTRSKKIPCAQYDNHSKDEAQCEKKLCKGLRPILSILHSVITKIKLMMLKKKHHNYYYENQGYS